MTPDDSYVMPSGVISVNADRVISRFYPGGLHHQLNVRKRIP
jgi:hypothetical protein